jgi:hypothetical protein
MRRVYAGTIMASLLLVLIMVGSVSSAGLPTQQSTPLIAGVKVATAMNAPPSTTKLSPPPVSVKPVPADPNYRPLACAAPVTNISQQKGNESESYVVINPTNPNNIVVFSNVDPLVSIFRAYSMDGGVSWTSGTVATNAACCDGQAAFDAFGNLFLVYVNTFPTPDEVNVILSTDSGVTFSAPRTVGTGGQPDQPSIAVGTGSVWVNWRKNGDIVARGASVTGLGMWGPFNPEQSLPNATGHYGGIAVGPGPNGGKVIVTYQDPATGEGPATIYVNVDADGLGVGGFGSRIMVATTNLGGNDIIPAEPTRGTTAEAGLIWDATGGLFNNRVYLVYTEEPINESNDTEIYLRTSTDDGMTWSGPVRVNDDPVGSIRSQFLPYITLDATSGTVAIGWYDARNDNGVPGNGGTNSIPNDDAEYYASYSTNGGATWSANTRLSGGFSNAANAGNGIDYGDFVGVNAHGGTFVGVWADNANCDGTNANGTLHEFDLYMGTMNIPGGPTPTPTPTRTPGPTSTPGACGGTNYNFSTSVGGIVTAQPTTDTGNHCADCLTRVDFPNQFNFALYNQSFRKAYVSSNGNLQFFKDDETVGNNDYHYPGTPPYACPLPAAGFPDFNNTIFAYWGDLRTDGQFGGHDLGVYTSMSGQAPNRIFNIEWHACQYTGNKGPGEECVDWGAYVNFEIRLYESPDGSTLSSSVNRSQFDIIYGVIQDGYNVVVGVQEGNGGGRTQYSCDGANLQNGDVVSFTLPPACTPTPQPPPPTSTYTYTPTNTSTPTNTYTPCPYPNCGTFYDVPTNDTFYPYISCLHCRNIVSGYPCGGPGEPCLDCTYAPYFRPGAYVTRGQLSKIVSNAAGFTEDPGAQIFQDVPPGPNPPRHPFYDWINRIARRGIVGGYACGAEGEPCVPPDNRPYFRPAANATRGHVAKMVSNAAGYLEPHSYWRFQDTPPDSTYYIWVERLASRGIMGGYQCGSIQQEPCVEPDNRPYFRPYNEATRAQTSKIVALTWPGSCQFPQPDLPVSVTPPVIGTGTPPLPAPTSPTQITSPTIPTVEITPPYIPSPVPSVPLPVPSVPVPIPTVPTIPVPSPSVLVPLTTTPINTVLPTVPLP